MMSDMTYNDLITNDKCILVLQKELYHGKKLDHTLINNNQVWHYGISFWDNDEDNARGLNINSGDKLIIPMWA